MVAQLNDDPQPRKGLPTIKQMRARVGDISERLDKDGHENIRSIMRERNLPTFSAFLEEEDRSDPEEKRAGLDAWRRLLIVRDIKTTSDPYGSYYADTVGKMGEGRAGLVILPEHIRRQWEAGQRASRQERAPAVFMSGDFLIGSIQRPWDDDMTPVSSRLEPAIPLERIIRGTVPTDGPDLRSRFLVAPTAAETRLLRVAEGAELPAATITEGQRTIRLRKFGRLLRATYEALRRSRLDEFNTYLEEIRVQTEVDQVGAAIDVAINGDGNANTSATVYNLTALDAGTTANNLTPAAYFVFKLKWRNPFRMNVILGREAAIVKLLSLALGNANTLVGNAQLPAGLRSEFNPLTQSTADGILWGATDDVPANYLLGLDTGRAIERALENGSVISEAERWITRQVEAITLSMNEAYRVAHPLAAKMLRLDA